MSRHKGPVHCRGHRAAQEPGRKPRAFTFIVMSKLTSVGKVRLHRYKREEEKSDQSHGAYPLLLDDDLRHCLQCIGKKGAFMLCVNGEGHSISVESAAAEAAICRFRSHRWIS